MQGPVVDHFEREWQALHEGVTPSVVDVTVNIVKRNASLLADDFYQTMLGDNEAGQFLTHHKVKQRLHGSMMQWLADLNSAKTTKRIRALYANQRTVGAIHARIDIPVSVVLKGARCLKNRYASLMDSAVDVPRHEQHASVRLFCSRIDLAMEVMSQAYTVNVERQAKHNEAYRLFSITENMATEKEKQKAALLNWESEVMFQAALGAATQVYLPRIRESDFGLWFQHKGAHAFQSVTECEVIVQVIEEVDTVCLPQIENSTSDISLRSKQLRTLKAHAQNLLLQLSGLFEKSLELESGKDVLTHLLNRKFLPTVLAREIDLCRNQGREFAVVSVDIDHFKRINDRYGHEAGDVAVQQVAALLQTQCRGGDFLFRMGGEEFLALLVDVGREQALKHSEAFRSAVEGHRFELPQTNSLKLTVSIGCAVYSGHPDYSYLLREADKALYEAKEGGRNRVCMV
ncbi:MAG TPA: diguanylate cyclase [Pusillimonas sp.]|nr:diguanylate cyclase [Pusillimonas sp.]|tara:strand:+ start:79283 stop:80659 length:1377 start_codon:yes stop_codon:yes gene_type:complete